MSQRIRPASGAKRGKEKKKKSRELRKMACQNERAVCPCHRSISAYTVRVRVAFKKGDARRSPSAARDQVGYIPKDIVGAVATLIGRPVLVPIARRATNRLNYSLDSSSLEFSFFSFTFSRSDGASYTYAHSLILFSHNVVLLCCPF